MMEDFEGTKEEFAKEMVLELREIEENSDHYHLNYTKAAIFISACSFLYDLCDESFGDLAEIDGDPGGPCTVSAAFDYVDIGDELFEWFKELLLQIDRLEFLPDHEEEAVLVRMTVDNVWEEIA